MLDPELILKSAPPRMPRQFLERERLAQFWGTSKSCAALLVTAPPGFGKTTLMLQWRMRWNEQGAAVAWYSVDANDDPVRFSAGILHAVRHARSPGGSVEHAARAGMEALTVLLAEIAQDGRETVLMIDDAERLPAATLPLLQYLLLNAPERLHLVIGSRVPLALQATELMARGHAARIDADQLRYRLEESLTLLERQLGPRLDTDQRARLHDATEGWPIGLQCAIAAIEHDPDPAAATRSLSARHIGLQEYLDGTLFAHIPEDMAQVLTRIAMLDNFNEALLSAITGRADADVLIAQLAQAAPVAVVGARSDWLRLHPLVRDVFRARFERLPTQEQAALHARASQWFIDHGHLHEAATHALAAGDETLAQDYAVRSLWSLGTWGMMDEARLWLDRISADRLARDTGLRLSAAMILTISDRNEDALRMAQEVFADPGATPEMRIMAMRVAAAAAAYADRLGLFPGIVAAWPDMPHMDPVFAMSRANTRAFALLHAGETAQARDVLGRTLPTAEAGESLRLAVPLGQMLYGMTHLWDGDPVLAVNALTPALARVEKSEGRRGVIACGLASILAAALLQTGQPDAARALLANRLDVIERFGFPDNVLMAYRTLAHIALQRDDMQGALTALAELDALGVRRKLPRMRVHSLAERIRIHAAEACNETAGELVDALQALLPAFDDSAFAPLRSHVRMTAGVAMAHAAIARGALDEAGDLLRDAALEARSLRDGREVRTILALQAAVAHQRGAANAQSVLREAMRLAHIAGDEDFQSQLHPLALRMLAGHDGVVAPSAPPQSARKRRRAAARSPQTSTGSLLTPKEMEVLALLHQGMSNKRIALTLDIGGETIKWHMKNLYAKLSAISRDHALDRARLLGLIGG